MNKLLVISLLLGVTFSCQSQKQDDITNQQKPLIGGRCEGCENFDVGKPSFVNQTDTSVLWERGGQRLIVHGKVKNRDGSAASEVEIFYWHTNESGKYELPEKLIDSPDYKYPHGWIKTDERGEFQILTIRPGAYPDSNIPAHIHLFVKEPDLLNAYYVDDLVFDDDHLLNTKYRRAMENRGGSGVLRLKEEGNVSHGEYTLILGLNIPDHPDNIAEKSGLPVGVDSPSFTPFHAFGPDAGKRVCPVCKYGKNVGILHFSKLPPIAESIKEWINFYELMSVKYQSGLKVYIICEGGEFEIEQLKTLGKDLDTKYLALTIVPSFQDEKSEVYLNNISDDVENTIVIYKNSRIIHKTVNVIPEKASYATIQKILSQHITSSFFTY